MAKVLIKVFKNSKYNQKENAKSWAKVAKGGHHNESAMPVLMSNGVSLPFL